MSTPERIVNRLEARTRTTITDPILDPAHEDADALKGAPFDGLDSGLKSRYHHVGMRVVALYDHADPPIDGRQH